MAENVPPNSSTDATRGVPYYEKLKRDLRETLQKKRLLDKNLVSSKSRSRPSVDSAYDPENRPPSKIRYSAMKLPTSRRPAQAIS